VSETTDKRALAAPATNERVGPASVARYTDAAAAAAAADAHARAVLRTECALPA